MKQKNKEHSIHIKKIVKRFREFELRIRDVEIELGDILAILGPNGSGKTTLLNILATIIKADICDVRILDYDLKSDSRVIRKFIGYVMHDFNLYEELSVYENLKIFLNIYKKNKSDLLSYVKPFLMKKFKELSYGQKKLVTLVKELIKEPKVLLLDEILSGLDFNTKTQVINILKEIRRKSIILLTTHNIRDAINICNKFLLLKNGTVSYYGSDSTELLSVLKSS